MEIGPQTSPRNVHVLSQLESYLLGALDDSAEFAVEEHLLHCSVCRGECDNLAELSIMIATLPTQAANRIVEANRSASVPPHRVIVADQRSRPPRSVGRTFKPIAVAAAALVLGIAIGSAGWAWLGPPRLANVPAGNESVNGLGAQMSVTLVDRAGNGIDLQAVVVGVQPGLDIELLAITADQHILTITRTRSAGGPQQLVGVMPANTTKVLLFMVVDSQHRVLAVTLS